MAVRGDRAGLLRAVIGMGLLLLVMTAGVPLQPPGDSLIRSMGIYRDATAELGIDAVVDRQFVPVGASVPIGYGQANHWLRVEVAPDPAGGEVLLLLRPVTLDRATLYLPDGQGGWITAQTGEKVATDLQSWPSLLRHPLALGALKEPVVAYVQVDSRSPASLYVTAFSAQAAAMTDMRTFVFHAFVFGLKGVSILMILLTLPRRQNRVNALFLALEVSFFAYLFTHLGYGQAILHDLPPAVLDYASAVAVTVVIMMAALFHRELLCQFAPGPAARRLALVPPLLAAAGLVTVVFGFRLQGLAMTSLAYALVVPAVLFLLLTLRQEAAPGIRYVRLTYALYLPFLILNLLTTTGVVELDLFYRSSLEFSAIVSSTLILSLVLLMNRALNRQWEEQRQAIRKSILARKADARLRRSQHVLTHLVASQTRDALSRLQAILSGHPGSQTPAPLARAMASLDDVVADCLQADEAETGVWHTTSRPFDVVALTESLISELPPDAAVSVYGPLRMVLVSDENLFAVILRHMLLNAVSYRQDDSEISLHIQPAARGAVGGLTLAVSNRIADAASFDPDRIFEKFYRGAAASGTSGTGLGLFICREIATILGGEINAAVAGQTVTFTLWLPDRA